jgi:hypothetical protein
MVSEKSIINQENKSLKKKANFIESHSYYLLDKMHKDENFKESLLIFLTTDDANDTLPGFDDINDQDYYQSLQVIFDLCYFVNDKYLSTEEKERYRDKLRLYTKFFKVRDLDYIKESKNQVLFDNNQLDYAMELEEEKEERKRRR